MPKFILPVVAIIATVGIALALGSKMMTDSNEPQPADSQDQISAGSELEKATFGAGCFWCIEAAFQQLDGVESVVSGYSGGQIPNPTYEQVCSGRTGHAEVVQVSFNPQKISYQELLEAFFTAHDPTQLNHQGNDYGTQYRSAIFFHDARQQEEALRGIEKLTAAGLYGQPIVTEVTAFNEFFPAEVSHQNYYQQNSRQPYCQMVIAPKIEKVRKAFADKVKKD